MVCARSIYTDIVLELQSLLQKSSGKLISLCLSHLQPKDASMSSDANTIPLNPLNPMFPDYSNVQTIPSHPNLHTLLFYVLSPRSWLLSLWALSDIDEQVMQQLLHNLRFDYNHNCLNHRYYYRYTYIYA